MTVSLPTRAPDTGALSRWQWLQGASRIGAAMALGQSPASASAQRLATKAHIGHGHLPGLCPD